MSIQIRDKNHFLEQYFWALQWLLLLFRWLFVSSLWQVQISTSSHKRLATQESITDPLTKMITQYVNTSCNPCMHVQHRSWTEMVPSRELINSVHPTHEGGSTILLNKTEVTFWCTAWEAKNWHNWDRKVIPVLSYTPKLSFSLPFSPGNKLMEHTRSPGKFPVVPSKICCSMPPQMEQNEGVPSLFRCQRQKIFFPRCGEQKTFAMTRTELSYGALTAEKPLGTKAATARTWGSWSVLKSA